MKDGQERVCIIGAGKSGLIASKVLHERGIPFDCFETGSQVCNYSAKAKCISHHVVVIACLRKEADLFTSYPFAFGLSRPLASEQWAG